MLLCYGKNQQIEINKTELNENKMSKFITCNEGTRFEDVTRKKNMINFTDTGWSKSPAHFVKNN